MVKIIIQVLLWVIVGYVGIFKIAGLKIIGNNKMGIVERWWARKGSLKSGIIALNKETGFLPEVLRGGIHFKPGLMFKVHIFPLITIPQGQMGYVFARSGEVLSATQLLGRVVPEGNNFQDVEQFLSHGGEQGPQRSILREGIYAINLAQFVVITKDNLHYLPLGDASERSLFEDMKKRIELVNGFTPVVIRGKEKVTQIIDPNNARTKKSSQPIDPRRFKDMIVGAGATVADVLDNFGESNFGSEVDYRQDLIGIVTVHDGSSLENGEIVAPIVGGDRTDEVSYHNNFQDPEKFLKAGGRKGLQLQVLTDGTYYINRLFATVEYVEKTTIPIGFVGVVVSFTGQKGIDASGLDYKHGELVSQGCKGVWAEPLMPGKYAFNTRAGEIKLVPTTNIILKWVRNQVGEHRLDANLSEIELITKDAFQPLLPLSVVLHIDYKKAPWVIQRFGDMDKLVNQTLDPLVASYFKNIGQIKTLIELIQGRGEIQVSSTQEMQEKFTHYNIELEEVLIGTPESSPNDTQMTTILEQLRQRQVAREQVATFESQQKAAEAKKALREAEAIAEQQSALTASEVNIKIEANKGEAEAKKAGQDAIKITTLANAEASKIKTIGLADAEKITAIGDAEASAIHAQVEAYGGAEYRLLEKVVGDFSEAVAQAKIDIVPKTVVNMGGGEGNVPNAFESLINLMVANNLGVDVKGLSTSKDTKETETETETETKTDVETETKSVE